MHGGWFLQIGEYLACTFIIMKTVPPCTIMHDYVKHLFQRKSFSRLPSIDQDRQKCVCKIAVIFLSVSLSINFGCLKEPSL